MKWPAMVLAATLAAPFAAAAAPATRGDDVVARCTQAVFDYAYFRDQLDDTAYHKLFTRSAELSFGGKTYSGIDAIDAELKSLRSAQPRMLSRHVMTNVRVIPRGPGAAEGTAYLSIYMAPQSQDPASPATAEGPLAVGVYSIAFETAKGTCRIAKSKLDITFTRPRPH